VYGIAAAGRPLVYIGDPDGEIARIVARHGVGLTIEPGDADGLASALLEHKQDPENRLAMGERPRALFEAQYDKPIALSKWETVLHEAAGIGKRPRCAGRSY
jgi:colanic acid biosynthesis glycosyl transferase WcaI